MKKGLRVLNGASFVWVGEDRSGFYFTQEGVISSNKIRLIAHKEDAGFEFKLGTTTIQAVFSDPSEKPR